MFTVDISDHIFYISSDDDVVEFWGQCYKNTDIEYPFFNVYNVYDVCDIPEDTIFIDDNMSTSTPNSNILTPLGNSMISLDDLDNSDEDKIDDDTIYTKPVIAHSCPYCNVKLDYDNIAKEIDDVDTLNAFLVAMPKKRTLHISPPIQLPVFKTKNNIRRNVSWGSVNSSTVEVEDL